VGELREALGQYDAVTLRELAVELYKTLPKDKKTEELDAMVRAFTKGKRLARPKAPAVPFWETRSEVEEFLANAAGDLYFRPNRTVSKDRRSKWRFEVRRLIKELVAVRGEDAEDAAKLLLEVYDMMSYACGHYILPTEAPFSAVGYEQPALLGLALQKLLMAGASDERIELAVCATLASEVDRETLHVSLLAALVGSLKTNPARETARDVVQRFPAAYDEFNRRKRYFRSRDHEDWSRKERRNRAVELYLMLSLALREPEAGIAYFNRNYEASRDEIKLYILLTYFLETEGLEQDWLREYRAAVAKGVQPRDRLAQRYAERAAAESRG
jgi:hypothetical protein